jgi:hypothetical protein
MATATTTKTTTTKEATRRLHTTRSTLNADSSRTYWCTTNPVCQEFRGYYWNEVSWFLELDRAGYKFRVLSDCYLVHLNHPIQTKDLGKFSYARGQQTVLEEFSRLPGASVSIQKNKNNNDNHNMNIIEKSYFKGTKNKSLFLLLSRSFLVSRIYSFLESSSRSFCLFDQRTRLPLLQYPPSSFSAFFF